MTAIDDLRSKLNIESLDDDLDRWINALIYGEAGAGKTHFLGTAADSLFTSPVLIFDVEGGLRTLRKFESKHQIERIKVRSQQDLVNNYNELFKAIDSEGNLPYRTIGLDSGTELTDIDMRAIMKAAYNARPETTDIDVPSPREWGIARNHMRTIIRAFKDLPCNFIMTANMSTSQEEGQPTKYFPGFAGKLRTEIPGFFDVVGLLSVDNSSGQVMRKLQTAATRRVIAKDRDGFLGDLLEHPTMPLVWDLTNNPKPATVEVAS